MYSLTKKNCFLLISALLTLVVLVLACMAIAYSTALSAPINQWLAAAPLPEVLASRNAIARRDTLYVIGGKNPTENPSGQVYTTQVQADGSLAAWNSTTPLPIPVYLHAVAATDSYIYVIGGWDGTQTRSEVWRAPFIAGGLGAWEKVTDYPIALDLHEATIVNNRLYVLGGWDGTAPLSTVYYADIQANGLGPWTPALNLPVKLYRLSAVSVNDVIYVTGGYDNNVAQSTVYYTKVNSDGSLAGWRQTTALPEARYYHETVLHDGNLVVIGGKTDTVEYNSVYAAPLHTDGTIGAWNVQPALPESLYRFAAVTVSKYASDFIYIFGGLHTLDYRSNVYHSTVPSPPTPTSTPTPGATPTPIPSITLHLQNDPQRWVAPGEEITYTLFYQNHGVQAAKDVVIASTIPADVELISGSVDGGASTAFTVTGPNAGDNILWNLGPLAPQATGAVGYRVRRLRASQSSVPRALSIISAGPATARADTPIQYQITVTNNVPITLTNLIIFNVLPDGAVYVAGADGPPVNHVVQWTVPTLAPDQIIHLNLTVTAGHSLINSNYWVTTEEGASAQGAEIVITLVDDTALPAMGDGVAIVNQQATMTWNLNGQVKQAISNPVFNPAFPAFLPVVTK